MSNYCLAPSYLRTFQCIGPQCPDSCCQNWVIRLHDEDLKQLQKQLGTLDPWVESSTGSQAQPHMKMTSCLECIMLTDGWCRLQHQFGLEGLPTICATFPRNLLQWDGQLYFYGSLACPEVTRLCFEAPNKASMKNYPRRKLPPRLNVLLPASSDESFIRYCEILTHFLEQTLVPEDTLKHQPLAFLLHYLETRPWNKDSGEAANFRLKTYLKEFTENPSVPEKPCQGFPFTTSPEVLAFLQNLLIARMKLPTSPSFKTRVQEAFDVRIDEEAFGQGKRPPLTSLWEVYQHGLSRLSPVQPLVHRSLNRLTLAYLTPWQWIQEANPTLTLRKLILFRALCGCLLVLNPLWRKDATAQEDLSPNVVLKEWTTLTQQIIKYFDLHDTMSAVIEQLIQGMKPSPEAFLRQLL